MEQSKTQKYHQSLTSALTQSQAHMLSRRSALRTSVLAAGGAAVVSLSGPAVFGYRSAMAQTFQGPVDVLNYALTLEHLEYAFYREFNRKFSEADFEAAGFSGNIRGRFDSIEAHEAAHVDVLITVINSLGGTPATEMMYSFGVTDVIGYVATAQVLENLGTGAYTGAAQFLIDNDELLTAALTIHGIEARHASYLNFINGDSPFPEAFETALTPEEVLAAATPLILTSTGMPATGSGSAADTTGPNMGTLAALSALGLGAAALASRARESRTPDQGGTVEA